MRRYTVRRGRAAAIGADAYDGAPHGSERRRSRRRWKGLGVYGGAVQSMPRSEGPGDRPLIKATPLRSPRREPGRCRGFRSSSSSTGERAPDTRIGGRGESRRWKFSSLESLYSTKFNARPVRVAICRWTLPAQQARRHPHCRASASSLPPPPHDHADCCGACPVYGPYPSLSMLLCSLSRL